MSRVGKKPIAIPDGVTVAGEGTQFTVKGKLGELSCMVPGSVTYTISDGAIVFARQGDRPQQRADHGLARALVNNMILGVTEGFRKTLELEGTGYKWEIRGSEIVLTVGYSRPIAIAIPAGVKCEIRGSTCDVSGADKQLVGFIAAQIRRVRKVEPYKGKGIRYRGEFVRRKAGKAGA